MEIAFDDKVALVTGGGSGIGEACALTFAEGGAKVVVADIDVKNGERVAQAITDKGGSALFVRVNTAQASDVEAMVRSAVSTYGKLDIAVNNAGIGGESNGTGAYSLESWHKVIDVNLHGVFYGLRYQIPAMLESGGGAIVNMASILGSVGFANSPAYVASKHAVVGLTKSAAIEYSAQGIRINSVGPGFIVTPLLEGALDDAATQAISQMHPIGRMGQSQEVANLVCFLCSSAASFMTGGYYVVDGAYTSQ